MDELPHNESWNIFAVELLRIAASSNGTAAAETGQAPNFNGFRLLDPNELRLSAVLANLLDPKGNHAQKDLFLKNFLGHFMSEHKNDSLEDVKVKPERSIEGKRRIDLVITSADFELAFENKPWASDQHRQVSDYLLHLRGIKKKTKLLVYLSHDGGGPSDVSICPEKLEEAIKEKQIKIIAYLSLVEWLEACEKEVVAPNVKHFLAEYIAYIEFQFDADQKAIAKKLQDASYVSAAFCIGIRSQNKAMPSNQVEAAGKVSAVLARFRLERLEELRCLIRSKLTEKIKWQPSLSLDFDANFYFGQRVTISIPEISKYVFSFAFKDRGISKELHWGIECMYRRDPPAGLKQIAKDFTERLNNACGKSAPLLWISGDTTWLCYQKFGEQEWDTVEPWQSILEDDGIALDMVTKIEELHKLLKEKELLGRLK